MKILNKLLEHRSAEEQLSWEGTFADYLKMVKENPGIAKLSHSRIYDMIESGGTYNDGVHTRYKFFDNHLFGLEEHLERVMDDYFKPAAHKLDVRKRVLLLMGPVSGGKSTFVSLLKRKLAEFSKTDKGAVYAIKGCPMHEEPLHLVPEGLRIDFEKEFDIQIEGNLCPVCRFNLKNKYNGDVRQVPVERVLFSEHDRIGIGTFAPSDPKSQDISELTGSIDFSTIAEYGTESDPRAYRFDGELNIANRGLMEFQEMLKCDEKFLWNLLSLTQEGNFKAGRYALISADELIIAHTNETEFKNFISNKKNEALHSRMIVMKMPYNLKLDAEEKIYEKMIKESNIKNVHLAPFALRAAAMFSILTRLEKTKKAGVDLVEKMKLYNNEHIEGYGSSDLQELRQEHHDEGMKGIDPRYVFNRISSALIKKANHCVDALDILKSLRDGLYSHPSIAKNERDRYMDLIGVVRKEYNEMIKKEAQKLLIDSYEGAAHTIFDNYLDNIEAYCNRTPLRDPVTGEELPVNEDLMRSIEEQIGISQNAKKAFREEILIRISHYARKGQRFNYDKHERLKEAIHRKLFNDLKDTLKLSTLTKSADSSQSSVVNKMIAEHNYCSACAHNLLKYTSSLLNI